MSEYKVVHLHVYEPHKPSLFGKSNRTERAEVQIISCCNSENCGLYSRDECSLVAALGAVRCPYGKYSRQKGFTCQAGKYMDWINEQKSQYKGVKSLGWHSQRMAVVGDYVFLPYPHMDMCKSVPFEAHSQGFSSGNCFLPLSEFTVANIILLVRFKPMALMGGEIASYQKEVPPKFLKHLSEQMPDLFYRVIATYEYAEERYKEFSNIGRKAVLETLNPNVGQFRDIHGGVWDWDGEVLKSNNSHASFMLVSKFTELVIRPEVGQTVAITDEGQVNESTVFVGG